MYLLLLPLALAALVTILYWIVRWTTMGT